MTTNLMTDPEPSSDVDVDADVELLAEAKRRELHRARVANLRARRLLQRRLVNGRWVATDPRVMHGRYATYQNWGCRCLHCSIAERDHNRLTDSRALERAVASRPATATIAAATRPSTSVGSRYDVQVVEAAVVRALAAIAERLDDPTFALVDVVNASGLAKRVLNDKFNGLLGEPPWRYVVRQRMQRAAEIAQATDLPHERIARAVGYASTSAFGVAFRRFHGVSVSAYRSLVRGSRPRDAAEAIVNARLDAPELVGALGETERT